MTRAFALVGKFALFIAAMAFLTALSMFVGGAYLASWPIMRISPRHRRVQSVMALAVAGMAAARAYGLDRNVTKDTEGDVEDTEPPEPMEYVPGDGIFSSDLILFRGKVFTPNGDHSEGGE